MFGQIGMDCFASNKTTISASYIKVHGDFKPTDISHIQTDSLTDFGNQPSYSTRYSDSIIVFSM